MILSLIHGYGLSCLIGRWMYYYNVLFQTHFFCVYICVLVCTETHLSYSSTTQKYAYRLLTNMKATRRQLLTDRESAFFHNLKMCMCVHTRVYVCKRWIFCVQIRCVIFFQEIMWSAAVRANELTTIIDVLHAFVFHSHLLNKHMYLNGKDTWETSRIITKFRYEDAWLCSYPYKHVRKYRGAYTYKTMTWMIQRFSVYY